MENDQIITNGLSLAMERVNEWGAEFMSLVPNIIAGLVLFILFLIIAFGARFSTRKYFFRRERIDLGRILSSISFWSFTLFGIVIALTIIMPSLKPGNLVASMGIGSLAIGFVFKDILQNWLSGLLILLRLPFRRGDQIIIGNVEGTVMRIDPRATILRTYDGRDIIVPNITVYSSNVTINTSQPQRRVELDLTVGYNYDIRVITRIIKNSLEQVDEILKDPAPQILCWNLGSTSLGIKLRWWIDSERSEEVVSRARAVQAIKEAFDANNIDPTDPQLIYYHEAKDGEEILGENKSSDSKNTNPRATEHNVTAGPKPPEFETSYNDPEADQPKQDSKSETMLTN
ncbi:MAG TPA: mechanosensitive ion channel family protein [Alphaproteobacteria bacterium]|nr:mechanosensitive ion channel family protein [Alphaproteobacteria bacterium]